MKRFAVFVLAGWCVLAVGSGAQAQLKERSLSDAPANAARAAQPAPAQTAPAQQPGAVVQPVPAHQVSSTPQPAQPAPAAQPAAPAPAGQVAPATPPAGAQPAPGDAQPAPPAGSTPINGSTNVTPPPPPPPPPGSSDTYSRAEVNREVMGFFEGGSRGLAEVVAKAFREQGQPNGFIKGSEGGGALFVGFRYGAGTLYLKGHPPVPVYWQSPSLGLDLGVNAVKVFTLVYNLHDPEELFQRFPAVDGSLYIIGGFGMNYQRSGSITLAPIRFGVGLRLGINAGYQHYTRTQSINPF